MMKRTLWTLLTALMFFCAAQVSALAQADPADAPAPVEDMEDLQLMEEAEAAEGLAGGASTPTLDSGDTAWMIVASALVLFMTLPGLALFYGGLVRTKNVLSILVQCFAICCVMSVLWMIYGYGVAAGPGGSFFGNPSDMLFLKHAGVDTLNGYIPESVYIMFQMTFAIITPALIVGAFAERMKFKAMMIFMVVWFTFSYLPVWHMAWGGGLFDAWGIMDFAGGTVVHINAGVAGLVACIMVGKRKGFPKILVMPHNVPLVVIGASMLWVGWFGFNAGSELRANGTAGMAMLVTQLATATAAATWMFIEWASSGKPTAVGLATGAVAGLVAITPASGSAGPVGALVIGAASGAICYYCATTLKKKLGYDDSLDVFGVHGVGGIVGALLTGVCASSTLFDGSGTVLPSVGAQLFAQFKSVIVTILWSGVVAAVALFVIDKAVGLRVDPETEEQGLDFNEHGETGYNS